MTHSIHSAREGFSLVELSIVLVILGLLVGGVLTGQSLIRAAELRSVTTEYEKYIAATHTFRDKYFALAGDMTNAVSFWGATVANGDGDGTLEVASAASAAGEMFGFWQQLALAGLIEGTYSGISGAGGTFDATIDTNVPRSKIGNAGWTAFYIGSITIASTNYFAGEYGNTLIIGGKTANAVTNQALLKTEEAWNIDTKMDDGRPAYGKVRSQEVLAHATNGCTNPAAATTAIESTTVYDLDNTGIACSLTLLMN